LFQKYASQAENQNVLREVCERLLLGILAPLLIVVGFFGKISLPRPAAKLKSHFCCGQIPFHSLYQLTKKAVDDKIVFWSIKSLNKPDCQRKRGYYLNDLGDAFY
jgi:hypothetical protein